MAYDTNTLTLKGAELLAAATAQDRLVLVGCDATTTYLDQASAVAIENRPTTPFSNTTDVYLIGSDANHVMARATFFAGQSTGGDANTLMLYGYKESAPNDIYVLYVASSQTAFHLPQSGDVANAYEGLFDIIYTPDNGAVTTPTTSLFVTLTEFNTMKERTVTTHKDGQPTVGENQTIYGNKEFKDYTTFNNIKVTNTGNAFLYYNGIASSTQTLINNNGIFTYGQEIDGVRSLNISLLANNGIIQTKGSIISKNPGVYSYLWNLTITDNIVPENNASFHPVYGDTGSDLGTQAKSFKTLYCYQLSSSGSYINAKKMLLCDGNVQPNSGITGTAIGSFTSPWTYGNIGGLRLFNNRVSAAYLNGNTVESGAWIGVDYDQNDSRGQIEAFTEGADLMLMRDSNGYGQFAIGLGTNSATTVLNLKYDIDSSYYKATLSMPLTVSNGLTLDSGSLLLTSGNIIIKSSISTSVAISEYSNNFCVSSNIIPDTTESYTIGTQARLWSGTYTQAVHFDGLASTNTDHAYIDTLNGSIRIMPKNQQTVTIGRDYSTYPCGLIVEGTVQIKGTLTSVGAITGNLTGNVTGNVTGNLNGLIPNPSTADSDTVPIGAIVLLNILFTSAQTYNYKYGSTFTTDNSSYTLSVSAFDATGLNSASSTSLASGQTFRTLSGAIFNNATSSHALAIRIS